LTKIETVQTWAHAPRRRRRRSDLRRGGERHLSPRREEQKPEENGVANGVKRKERKFPRISEGQKTTQQWRGLQPVWEVEKGEFFGREGLGLIQNKKTKREYPTNSRREHRSCLKMTIVNRQRQVDSNDGRGRGREEKKGPAVATLTKFAENRRSCGVRKEGREDVLGKRG